VLWLCAAKGKNFKAVRKGCPQQQKDDRDVSSKVLGYELLTALQAVNMQQPQRL
jgi:hypothetical protein